MRNALRRHTATAARLLLAVLYLVTRTAPPGRCIERSFRSARD